MAGAELVGVPVSPSAVQAPRTATPPPVRAARPAARRTVRRVVAVGSGVGRERSDMEPPLRGAEVGQASAAGHRTSRSGGGRAQSSRRGRRALGSSGATGLELPDGQLAGPRRDPRARGLLGRALPRGRLLGGRLRRRPPRAPEPPRSSGRWPPPARAGPRRPAPPGPPGSAAGTRRCTSPGWPRSAPGVPSAITWPPREPPSGPMSISQSAVLITSRLCSITTTVLPASTSRPSTPSSLRMSSKCRPVVGSSSTYRVRPVERFCSSLASLTRCASPPDRVGAGWPSRT